MKIPFNKSALVSALVLAGASSSSLVMAQDAPKSKVTSLMLEEVVVTARSGPRTPRTYRFPSRP